MREKSTERTTASDELVIKTQKGTRHINLPSYGKVEVHVHQNKIMEVSVLKKERLDE